MYHLCDRFDWLIWFDSKRERKKKKASTTRHPSRPKASADGSKREKKEKMLGRTTTAIKRCFRWRHSLPPWQTSSQQGNSPHDSYSSIWTLKKPRRAIDQKLFTPRTDDLYDLYDLYDLHDLLPLHGVDLSRQIDLWSVPWYGLQLMLPDGTRRICVYLLWHIYLGLDLCQWANKSIYSRAHVAGWDP